MYFTEMASGKTGVEKLCSAPEELESQFYWW
jgi:hypothetical protein